MNIKDIANILAEDARLTVYVAPAQMMLVVTHDALDRAAEALGVDLEQDPSPSIPFLAERLGVDDEDLYAAVAEVWGVRLIPDEMGEIDEDGEAISVTQGETVADMIRDVDITGGPDGAMHHPRLGWLPIWWVACDGCGVRGRHEDTERDHRKLDEAAEWLVRHGVDPRGLEDLPEVTPTTDARFICDNCWEDEE